MKRFTEQFKKQSQHVRMRADERRVLRARIVSYMEYHPLSAKTPAMQPAHALSAQVLFARMLQPMYVRSFASLCVMFVIIGVPFVAERSMPGDILYPVKVQFNEELRSSLSLSPYAKVEWETERLERRLAEARLLASEGKLTQEAEAKVAQAVQSHTSAAQREIETLRQTNSDEAAIAEITFASALAVQSEVLEAHLEKDGNEKRETGTGGSVQALASVVAQARDTAQAAQAEDQPSYKTLLGYVEQESTHMYELFATVQDRATQEQVADVQKRLAAVERKIAQADALKEGRALAPEASTFSTMSFAAPDDTTRASSTGTAPDSSVASSSDLLNTGMAASAMPIESVSPDEEAVAILSGVLADIHKLLSYMTNLEVRQNVSIEELVPLTPVQEEPEAGHVVPPEEPEEVGTTTQPTPPETVDTVATTSSSTSTEAAL